MYGSAPEVQLVNNDADGTNLNAITFQPGSVQVHSSWLLPRPRFFCCVLRPCSAALRVLHPFLFAPDLPETLIVTLINYPHRSSWSRPAMWPP